jgi:apolipoprotein N-acyltransferase
MAARIYIICFSLLWIGLSTASMIASPYNTPIAMILIAIGLAFGIRITSLGFVADESGLLVRNFFQTRQFGWGEVEDFRWGRLMGMPFGQVIYALLRDGELVSLDISTSYWGVPFGRRPKMEQMLQRLREWLPRQD